MKKINFNIIANTIIEPGMSGGNRIFIELAKKWTSLGLANIKIQTTDVGKKLCLKNGFNKADFCTWKIPVAEKEKQNNIIIILLYVFGTFKGTIPALGYRAMNNEIVYSSSDYWPDSLPALIMKLKNRNVKWIAGFFLSAPKPWQKDTPYKGLKSIIGILYYFSQMPMYWLIKKYADLVFVTSEPDVNKFITKNRSKEKIIVVKGGVDTTNSNQYLSSHNINFAENKLYDACFIGRFHPQKGTLELIDIWKNVCKKMPNSKLAMIGNGPLYQEAIKKTQKYRLENNIIFCGFRDGEQKYEIFKQSKIVVHPATYDSGGMATCEALAWGLPGISFDLEALKTYYPKGIIKTECFNYYRFAENILFLLKDKRVYTQTRQDAITLAQEWSWEKRSKEIFENISINLQN